MKSIYQNSKGFIISLVIEEDGVPVVLTSATVTLNLYAFGTDALKWTHAATIDDATNGLAHWDVTATDFNTLGEFYSNIVVTKTDYAVTYVGEQYKVIEEQASKVTPSDLLKFMDIPSENAKPDSTIQLYIDQAQSLLHLEVPTLATSVNAAYIQLGQNLIMLKAAITYFMNSGESNINPEIRTQKIKLWSEEYSLACAKLNAVLSSTATDGSGIVRRVYNKTNMPSPLKSNYSPYSQAGNTDND